jgi:hypothetical protein
MHSEIETNLSVNVLFTHLVPYNIVISKQSPSPTNLGGLAERRCVEIAEDLEPEFWRKKGEKVDVDHIPHLNGEEGELREAAGGEDALKDKVSLLSWGGGEDGPNMGYALLVRLREGAELLVKVSKMCSSRASRRTVCSCSIDGPSACLLHFRSGRCRLQ